MAVAAALAAEDVVMGAVAVTAMAVEAAMAAGSCKRLQHRESGCSSMSHASHPTR